MHQFFEIVFVYLAKDAIYPFSSLLATSVYQFRIIRGDHHSRINAYMIGYFFIFDLIFIYFFFSCFPFAANYFIPAIPCKNTGYPKAIKTVLYAVLLVRTKVTLCIAQVVDRIEQVGLTTAIGPCNTGDRGGKLMISR